MRGKLLALSACALFSGCTALAPDGLDLDPSWRAGHGVHVAGSTLGPGAAVDAENPKPLAEYDPRKYELLMRLEGERARVLGYAAQGDWHLDLKAKKGQKPYGQVPAVAQRMLSMADAAWRTPSTAGRHKSLFKETERRRRVEAIRLVAHFSPKTGVRCAAQQKLFADSFARGPMPSDATVDAIWAEWGLEADDMPRIELPSSGGQLLLRLRDDGRGEYLQELHVAYDYDAPKEGEIYEIAMTCRGPLAALTGSPQAQAVASTKARALPPPHTPPPP